MKSILAFVVFWLDLIATSNRWGPARFMHNVVAVICALIPGWRAQFSNSKRVYSSPVAGRVPHRKPVMIPCRDGQEPLIVKGDW
jgi:hypothetical protein